MRQKRIMIVEDEGVTAMRLQRMLRDAGYRVLSIEVTGEEAIKKAARERPDLIIMDILLAGTMDGIDASEHIREDFSIPVLFLTAHSDRKTLERAKTTGASGYIVKPFEKHDVLIAVEMALYKHEIEQRLRESEERFREVVEGSNDLITSVNAEGRFIYVNSVARRIFGISADECAGRSAFRFVHPDDRKSTAQWFRECTRKHLSRSSWENRQINIKTGIVRHMLWTSHFFFNEKGELIKANGIGADITDRKQAEEAIREQEIKFHSLFNQASDSIFLLAPANDDLIIEDANEAACRTHGYAKEQLIGMSISRLHNAEAREHLAERVQGLMAGTPLKAEELHLRRDGSAFPVEISAQLIHISGKPYVIAIDRDITERKRAEEELSERMQLAQLNADIGAALTEGETLQCMLQGCCEALVLHLGALFARIWLYNEEENVLELKASAGEYTDLKGRHSRKSLNGNKIGIIARERKAILTNNLTGDSNIIDQEWVKREGVSAFAGHPLIVENRLLGVMALFSRNHFTVITLNALMSVADVIAVGVDHKLTENKVNRAKEEWEKTFDIIPDLIAVIDEDYKVLRANKAMADILNMNREEIIGKRCFQLLHGSKSPPDYCPHKKCITSGKECVGEIYEERLKGHFILSANPVYDSKGNITGTVQVARNISKRKQMEQKLEDAAIRDELTGLFNRRGFFTLANQQCKLADRSRNRMSLLYIDMDGFKDINDELGHQEGDQALIDTANILRKTFRESDIIARIGGDEFVVLLTEPSGSTIEELIMNHVHTSLRAHNEQAGRKYELHVSMGMSHYMPDHPCSVSELLQKADELMYEDKKHHKLGKEVEPLLKAAQVPKRIFRRFSTGDDCWAELDVSGMVRIKNISMGGACLKTPEPLIIDSMYRIRMHLRKDEEITLTGTVVWASPPVPEKHRDDKFPCESGLKFTELSDSLKSSLETCMGGLKS